MRTRRHGVLGIVVVLLLLNGCARCHSNVRTDDGGLDTLGTATPSPTPSPTPTTKKPRPPRGPTATPSPAEGGTATPVTAPPSATAPPVTAPPSAIASPVAASPSAAAPPHAQQIVSPKVKIYRTDSLLYPFVQIYFRTLDQERHPFANLNTLNVGIMVQGRPYDPHKAQYAVQTLDNRGEAVRSVLVLDASQSIQGPAFDAARTAAVGFFDNKRPQDEVAVLAIRDTSDKKKGYQTVSDFERDGGTLRRRLGQVVPDGAETRLYDTIGAAMEMCAGAAQGGTTTEQAEYIPSCSIVVFSDGRDEGSAASRNDLMGRITHLSIPVPIYSFANAVAKSTPLATASNDLKNLQSLSNNSFGKYYDASEAAKGIQDVHRTLCNDYVLTFRSYLGVDGNKHPVKLGIEYPSGTGKIIDDTAEFEANQALPIPAIQERIKQAAERIKALPDNNPYLSGDSTGGDDTTPSSGRKWWQPF